MRAFGRQELTRALTARGLIDVQQRVSGLAQFVAASQRLDAPGYPRNALDTLSSPRLEAEDRPSTRRGEAASRASHGPPTFVRPAHAITEDQRSPSVSLPIVITDGRAMLRRWRHGRRAPGSARDRGPGRSSSQAVAGSASPLRSDRDLRHHGRRRATDGSRTCSRALVSNSAASARSRALRSACSSRSSDPARASRNRSFPFSAASASSRSSSGDRSSLDGRGCPGLPLSGVCPALPPDGEASGPESPTRSSSLTGMRRRPD